MMDSLKCTRPLRWKLAFGTWNVTSLVFKESELECEMDRCGLDIVYGLSRGCSLSYSVERGIELTTDHHLNLSHRTLAKFTW